MSALDTPLNLRLPAQLVKKLAAANIHTVGDLLYHAPRRYYHWGHLTAMRSLQYGQDVTLLARVVSASLLGNRQRGGVRLEVTLTDGADTMTATFFGKNQYSLVPHQKLLIPGSSHLFAGKVGQYRGRLQLTHPQFEEAVEGDEEAAQTRQERPIPIYPLSHGLTPWVMQRAIKMVLDALDDAEVPEYIPEEIRRQHHLLGHAAALRMLHQPATDEDFQLAQRSLRWHEAFTLQVALRMRRAGLAAYRSFPALSSDAEGAAAAIRAALPFALTQSQEQALSALGADLRQDSPMVRLLQGDVGSGKTVVALLASALMTDSGYQVAMLVPTEVLAEQHTESLRQMVPAGVDLLVECLTASTPAAVRAQIFAQLEAGTPTIVVGTHALLEDGIPFTTLGLVIIDEQHRFGVAQRDVLRERFSMSGADGAMRIPHQLVMTATPIPRTVAMTVFGDLDETRMTGMPSGRTPVATFVVDSGNATWMERLWQRADEEIRKGGRVYVVCPRIDADDATTDAPEDDSCAADALVDIEELRGALGVQAGAGDAARGYAASVALGQNVRVPLASVAAVADYLRANPHLAAHGIQTLTSRNSSAEKALIMADFAAGRAPILVATTVIEVGVNVPEATMMIILDAQQFGLSQLHQLRGRVGRSTTPSICMAVHRHDLAPDSMERLQAFATTTDGFELARADVSLRKEGDVLGKEQSGRATSLRFLSVGRDETIIDQARQAAHTLVANHPDLAPYSQLAALIRTLNSGAGQWMEKT